MMVQAVLVSIISKIPIEVLAETHVYCDKSGKSNLVHAVIVSESWRS